MAVQQGVRRPRERARRVVERGLSQIFGGGRRGQTRPDADLDPGRRRHAERVSVALSVVRQVESVEPSLPHTSMSREFLALDRAIRRPDLADFLQTMLPGGLQGDWDEHLGEVHTVSAPVAADAVVLAKFDLSEQVKLRAAYGATRRTVAVQPDRANGTSGIAAAVRAHEIVARYAPGLVPRMTGHGELGEGLRYLVEDWVDGVPLMDSERMAAHMPHILEGLDKVHRGYGIHAANVSKLWGRFAEQWQVVRTADLVSEEIAAKVSALIAHDRRVRVSWSHGDLVASNIMATDGGVTIIDWEHARERPIMHDAAKLHQFTADKESVLEVLLAEWGRKSATHGYRPAEELALLHARLLCRAPERMRELAGHRRQGVYARQIKRQAALLSQTLERVR